MEEHHGRPVELTIEGALQTVTETALDETRLAGAVVVVEMANGHIRAISSAVGRNADPLLHAIAPGATFMPIVGLAAHDSGNAPKPFTCSGSVHIGNRRFVCTAEHGAVQIEDALAHSCNQYFFEAARRTGRARIAAQAVQLGFGEAPLEGVASDLGRVTSEEPAAALFGFAIGQSGVTATPLQLARAYWGLIRGQLPPQLTLMKGPTPQGRQPLSAEAITRLRGGFRLAVTSGTASRIDDAALPIAGKTGTAMRSQGRNASTGDLTALRDDAWFAGYSPVEAPRHLVVVLLENAGGGGQAAALLAQRVLRGAEALPRHELR